MNCPKCKKNHEYRSEAMKCLNLLQCEINKIVISGKGKIRRPRLNKVKNQMYTYINDFIRVQMEEEP